MAKDYRDILKKILADHPEIAAINVEYKRVERLTIGEPSNTPAYEVTKMLQDQAIEDKIASVGGYVTPSGLRPVFPAQGVTPELIAKLKGKSTIETISVLNAPPPKA